MKPVREEGENMTSRDCIEDIRDAINQIEFYVELKIVGASTDRNRDRRYEEDIGRAVSKLVELRLKGTLSDQVLEDWHNTPADHGQGFITGLVNLTDHLKMKYDESAPN
jgi:hypothetical protein